MFIVYFVNIPKQRKLYGDYVMFYISISNEDK